MKSYPKVLAVAFLLILFVTAVLVGNIYRNNRLLALLPLSKARMGAFAMASANYFNFYMNWPRSLDDLFSNTNVFVAPDMPRTDVWGRAIQYQPFDPKLGFGVVRSLGRDGMPGGTNADADIEVYFGPFGTSPNKPGPTGR